MRFIIGPYFKYRTYWDLFNHNYWRKAAYINILIKKIRMIPTLIVCYLITSWMFPLNVSKNTFFVLFCNKLFLFYKSKLF